MKSNDLIGHWPVAECLYLHRTHVPTSRFATIDMGRKLGDFAFLEGRGAGSPSNAIYGLSRGLTPYQVASLSIQPFGHNIWAENWEAVPPPLEKGRWVPI